MKPHLFEHPVTYAVASVFLVPAFSVLLVCLAVFFIVAIPVIPFFAYAQQKKDLEAKAKGSEGTKP